MTTQSSYSQLENSYRYKVEYIDNRLHYSTITNSFTVYKSSYMPPLFSYRSPPIVSSVFLSGLYTDALVVRLSVKLDSASYNCYCTKVQNCNQYSVRCGMLLGVLWHRNYFLPDELRQRIPAHLASLTDDDPLVCVKLFCPGKQIAWYILECDGGNLHYGLIVSKTDTKFGYYTYSEVREQGARIDWHFTPVRLSQIMEEIACS
jgi:hypothetical protein